MSPAIRLGADRLLLVALKHVKHSKVAGNADPHLDQPDEGTREGNVAAFPKPLFLAGKALNALMLDHTEYDLMRMQRINLILEAGRASFGDRFEDMMNHELVRLRGAPLRRIRAVHIRPSVDIGALAADVVNAGRMRVDGVSARRLIHRL